MSNISIFIKRYDEGKENMNEDIIAVMAALNYLASSKHDQVQVTVQSIYSALTGKFPEKMTQLVHNHIKNGINGVVENGYAKCLWRNKSIYIFDVQSIMEMDMFILITDDAMRKIFNEDKVLPFSLFYFYVMMLSHINAQIKYWRLSGDKIIEYGYCGSKKTMKEYLDRLMEMKLLYVCRPKIRTDEGYKLVPNFYGRYEDKEEIIRAAESAYGVLLDDESEEQINRSAIRRRFNNFTNGSEKYKDFKELCRLYDDCEAYNESLKGPDKASRLIDLSLIEDAML